MSSTEPGAVTDGLAPSDRRRSDETVNSGIASILSTPTKQQQQQQQPQQKPQQPQQKPQQPQEEVVVAKLVHEDEKSVPRKSSLERGEKRRKNAVASSGITRANITKDPGTGSKAIGKNKVAPSGAKGGGVGGGVTKASKISGGGGGGGNRVAPASTSSTEQDPTKVTCQVEIHREKSVTPHGASGIELSVAKECGGVDNAGFGAEESDMCKVDVDSESKF